MRFVSILLTLSLFVVATSLTSASYGYPTLDTRGTTGCSPEENRIVVGGFEEKM